MFHAPPLPPLPDPLVCRGQSHGRHAAPCHSWHAAARVEQLSVGAIHLFVGRRMPEPSAEDFRGRHCAPDVTVEYALAA